MLGVLVHKPNQRPAAPTAQSSSSRAGGVQGIRNAPQTGAGRTASPDKAALEMMRQNYLASPADLANLRHQIPQLADAINDPEKFAQLWQEFQRRQKELQAQRERDMALLEADPFDVEAQRRIEELIRLERVDENLEQTREYHPEGKPFPSLLPLSFPLVPPPLQEPQERR